MANFADVTQLQAFWKTLDATEQARANVRAKACAVKGRCAGQPSAMSPWA